MNKIKITTKEAMFIENRKKFLNPLLLNCYLEKNDSNKSYTITHVIKLIPYLVLFIPTHLMQIFFLLWDGGLKEFSINKPCVHRNTIISMGENYKGPSHFKNAEEVWNKYNSTVLPH